MSPQNLRATLFQVWLMLFTVLLFLTYPPAMVVPVIFGFAILLRSN